MRYDGISVKNLRSTNMDGVLLKERMVVGKAIYLAVVCDGVGSMEDGALASAMATELLGGWFDSLHDLKGMGTKMLGVVAEINGTILRTAREQRLRTASTLSALLLDGSNYYIVHAGDSRIYVYRDGVLRQLTRDQTNGGKLTSCIGRMENVPLVYDEGKYENDIFLLCTDGLYRKLTQENICGFLASAHKKGLENTIRQMVSLAMEKGERDNISLAILMNER